MVFKALTSFLVLPGVVAFLLPCMLSLTDPWRGEVNVSGLFVMAGGLFILLVCVRDFYVAGKGTLAPWSPPRQLVSVGLYRFCRNPMYVGVLILIGGWALFAASPVLACYVLIVTVAFHWWVILYEEPRLSQLFDAAWESYAASVPRWVPRFPLSRTDSHSP